MSGSALKFSASGDLKAVFKAYLHHAVDAYDKRRDELLVRLNEKVLSRTPVWEGDTVHNWRWSIGAPNLSHEDPIDTGPPGATNQMPLGSEPRRSANEASPRQSLAAVMTHRDPVAIYLTNTADSAASLEYGLLPSQARSRSPAGMVRISVLEVLHGIA